MAETVLVTGGSGYIGGWCVIALLRRGYTVRTTVRNLDREAAVRGALATELDPDALTRLSFHAAELTRDAGWAEAVAGCDYVLHVASPLQIDEPRDPQVLIGPARDGALRVLKASVAAGVKRVVMTSSVAAATPEGAGAPEMMDETVWTDPAAKGVSAYAQSKTIAEHAAWDYMATLGEGAATTLVTVNPSLVLGPVLSADFSSSVEVVGRMMQGRLPGLPRLGFNIVDVRDVAELHLMAMTAPEAAGQRLIAAGDFLWMREMAAMLKDRLGPRASKVPTRAIPDFVVRIGALFDPAMGAISHFLGRRREHTSAKAQRLLGWRPRPAEEAVLACAESLIAKGVV